MIIAQGLGKNNAQSEGFAQPKGKILVFMPPD